MTSTPRISRIVSAFLSSEYFSNWQAERIESGSYSHNEDRRDRYTRCYDAAENGADGSTHRERIEDMREAFRDWLHDYNRNNSRLPFAEYPYRVEAAVMAHFDNVEQWHIDNGSIDQEVG